MTSARLFPILSSVLRWLLAATTGCALLLGLADGSALGSEPGSRPGGGPRSLTLAQRVAAQRSIEEVLWRHRIWPKENPEPRPPLESVLTDEAIRQKVTDYLKKSNALAKFWNRPITGGQLQWEMERMARNTRQPKVLLELFAALHGDPFLISECLARPILAERNLHSAYANDRHLHQAVRQQAERDLDRFATPERMRAMQGRYRETIWIKTDRSTPSQNSEENHLAPEQYETLMGSLRERLDSSASSGEPPIGKVGPLREDENSFSVIAVLSLGTDRVRVASVTWDKTPYDVWWKGSRNLVTENVSLPMTAFNSVSVEPGSCTDDEWSPTGESTPAGRAGHTAVWTGSEMIIWGGQTPSGISRTGSRYNPATDSWVPTFNDGNSAHVPAPRSGHVGVWTGSRMIVWSGASPSPGGIYDPLTDTWDLDMGPQSSNPTARSLATAVWTGSEMIVWGGSGLSILRTGGRFNPATKTWIPTSIGANVPAPRQMHSAVWTGSEMIIWGGRNNISALNSGGRYNPLTDSWTPTGSGDNLPSPRQNHTAIWTGSEMIVWGGYQSSPLATGARYDPFTDAWASLGADPNTPAARYRHSAVWTGTEMIVWGGETSAGLTGTGGRYNPSTGSWSQTSAGTIPPEPRSNHTAVWTGAEMIVWGGSTANPYLNGALLNSGARYDPLTDSWTLTSVLLAPGPRVRHSSVWTGIEMLVWGGGDPVFFAPRDSGGSYQAATASWEYVPALGVEARSDHSAVWTGTEMIIWGGRDGSALLNSGGRYNPAGNTWTPTNSATDVPEPREGHTAVWTGTKMILWGGQDSDNSLLNDGGRYDPSTDSWTPVNLVGAPSARRNHTVVWTGNEMIVWGGTGNSASVNTGGRYSPSADAWVSMGTGPGTPDPRFGHSAVWTGNEMIVWGGIGVSQFFDSGARYAPASDTWLITSPAPIEARVGHQAVWTGHEMIIFGGFLPDQSLALTHARYNPSTDSWRPISSASPVSLPRSGHTALWTGEEMIVYGGAAGESGARYCRLCPTLYTYFADEDGDLHGDMTRPGNSCDAIPPPLFVSDSSDCSDSNPHVWSAPAEVGDLEILPSTPTNLIWSSAGASSGPETAYDVVGGALAGATGSLSLGTAACLQSAGPVGFMETRPDPASDSAFWYLVRGRNSCGIGTLGTGSFGLDRDSAIPACP